MTMTTAWLRLANDKGLEREEYFNTIDYCFLIIIIMSKDHSHHNIIIIVVMFLKFTSACIAQLVRALDLKTRGCGFDSGAGQPNNY